MQHKKNIFFLPFIKVIIIAYKEMTNMFENIFHFFLRLNIFVFSIVLINIGISM